VWVTRQLSRSRRFLSFKYPAWTRDGRRLVFLCNSFSGHELCTTTTSGTGFRYITHCDCVNTGASDAPDVSSRNRVVWAYGNQLFTASAFGGPARRIATTRGTEDTFFEYPSWSPDGKTIAVQVAGLGSGQGGKPRGIYIADPSGSTLQPAFLPPADNFDQYLELDWAPKPR